MLNKAMALFALATFAVFIIILLWFVRQPDLAVAILIGLALATYDFWRDLFARRR